jgi:hypothetical protein
MKYTACYYKSRIRTKAKNERSSLLRNGDARQNAIFILIFDDVVPILRNTYYL